MLGANVGTTLTSQVLSFDLSWLSPLMIAAGVISFLSSEQDKPRHLGRVAIGLGLMLLSLQLLTAGTEPLRTSPSFVAAARRHAGRVRDRRAVRRARDLGRRIPACRPYCW